MQKNQKKHFLVQMLKAFFSNIGDQKISRKNPKIFLKIENAKKLHFFKKK